MTRVLETKRISKSYYGVMAVQDVSIHIDAGQILGLIGQNGAGKSTLMNLIGGVVTPDSGSMIYQGAAYAPRAPIDASKARIAFIHQELNLFTNLSIAENIFIDAFPQQGWGPFRSIDWGRVKKETQKVLEVVGLDLEPDMTVDRISPGERQLVEIARAIYLDASLIIFDEPTTSLTARETEKLFTLMQRLRDQGKAIIYISHILNDVLALSDSIAVMRDGQLVVQEEVQAFNISRMISLMVGRSIDQLFPMRSAAPSTDKLMQVRGLRAKGIVENINLTLYKGEVLGMFGLMGSGRTELARMLFGVDSYDSGEIEIAGATLNHSSPRESIRKHLAFVTENRREEGLLMNINIEDNIALATLPDYGRTALQAIDRSHLSGVAQDMVRALQLKSGEISTQMVKSLSGGNQQKVVIAKWLLSDPQVFIMDEPTRGVDVGAKYEIYSIIDQLAANQNGVLFISSELEELVGLCDRILVMSQGEIFAEFTREEFEEERILRAAFREETGKPA